MLHRDGGIVEHLGTGLKLAGADEKLRFLAAVRVIGGAAGALTEAAHHLRDVAAHRHVAANRVSNAGAFLGLAAIAAAHHPVELLGKPGRPALRPHRHHLAAGANDIRIRIER